MGWPAIARNPTTGKLLRNPATGKLMRFASAADPCCCEPETPVDPCVATGSPMANPQPITVLCTMNVKDYCCLKPNNSSSGFLQEMEAYEMSWSITAPPVGSGSSRTWGGSFYQKTTPNIVRRTYFYPENYSGPCPSNDLRSSETHTNGFGFLLRRRCLTNNTTGLPELRWDVDYYFWLPAVNIEGYPAPSGGYHLRYTQAGVGVAPFPGFSRSTTSEFGLCQQNYSNAHRDMDLTVTVIE